MVDNQHEELSEINKQSDAALSARSVFVSSGSTSEPLEDGFACNLCARMFKSKRGLNQHMRSCRIKERDPTTSTETHRYAASRNNFNADSASRSAREPSVDANDFSFFNQSNVAQANVASLPFSNLPDLSNDQNGFNGNMPHAEQQALQQSVLTQQKICGSHTKDDVSMIINAIYEEIVLWRRNIFMVPTGASGKKFVNEIAKWLNFWNQESDDYMAIALKVVMVMPAILLQKPSFKSTSKEHSQCLERRLGQWEKGEFDQLLHEMRTIQSKLPTDQRKINEDLLAKRFAKLMFEGKVNSALRLLDTAESRGNVLPLSPDTIEKLKQKHPTASEAHESVMMNGPVPFVDPVLYQSIDAKMIMNASLKTKGASGPSGFDAESWRRILVSKNFGNAGHLLRETVAAFARKMCVSSLDPDGLRSLEAFVACRLIPLDKNPGVRPIGVGEVLRRIVGKAVVFVIKPEIMSSAGNLQLCAGQQGGSEASVHAMTDIFDEESTDALLLVDATNAFNCLNRNVLLNNIKYLCPPMATYVTNCYSMSSTVFQVICYGWF